MAGEDSPEDDSFEDDSSVDEFRKIAEKIFESEKEGIKFSTDLVIALSVIRTDVRSHFTIQKFARFIAKEYDVESFKLMSLYLGGACSLEITACLHELDDAGFLSSRESRIDGVDTDVYELTPKAKQWLEDIDNLDEFEEAYKRFNKRYGSLASWDIHDRVVYNWLTSENNYLGYDKKLYEALKRKAVNSDELDPLFSEIIENRDSSPVSSLKTEIRGIAKLAYYIAKEAKTVPPKEERENNNSEFVRNRRKFSLRHIKDDFGDEGIENDLVLLRGYVEKRVNDRVFYLSEDQLSSSESIQVEFFGEWTDSPEAIQDNVIGIVGYVTGSDGEPAIKALAILKWTEIPERVNEDSNIDDKLVNQVEDAAKEITESQQQFFENHSGRVKDRLSRDYLEDVINDLREGLPEKYEVRKKLDDFKNEYLPGVRKSADWGMRITFLIDLFRRYGPDFGNLF